MTASESSRAQSNRVCDNCGNLYDKTITVVMNGETHYFDAFECAIQMLAPRCTQCETRIIGHGIEADGVMYCCANCAEQDGIEEAVDRVYAG